MIIPKKLNNAHGKYVNTNILTNRNDTLDEFMAGGGKSTIHRQSI